MAIAVAIWPAGSAEPDMLDSSIPRGHDFFGKKITKKLREKTSGMILSLKKISGLKMNPNI